MRIVSLIPSATEIIFALGLGDELVGRTHECDYPLEVGDVPVVTALADEVAEEDGVRIHERVAEAARGGEPIHRLDAELLRRLEPDLVLTQDLCGVCAVSHRDVSAALGPLADSVNVVSLEPRSIEGILNTISTIGAYTEAEDEAIGLVELLRERLAALENRILERRLQGVPSRRAVVLEWLEPPFAAGHWVPEMVRRAGGWELLGRSEDRSVQTSWEHVREVQPEVIVLALCGFDAARAVRELEKASLPAWFDEINAVREGEFFAVDGSGLFSRPGPRVIDGVAVLAELFDPEAFADSGPNEAWIPLSPVGIGANRAG